MLGYHLSPLLEYSGILLALWLQTLLNYHVLLDLIHNYLLAQQQILNAALVHAQRLMILDQRLYVLKVPVIQHLLMTYVHEIRILFSGLLGCYRKVRYILLNAIWLLELRAFVRNIWEFTCALHHQLIIIEGICALILWLNHRYLIDQILLQLHDDLMLIGAYT